MNKKRVNRAPFDCFVVLMPKGSFHAPLARWYEANRRDLPWRKTRDPYRVWVSEMILQQTRVDQGLSYYLQFIRRFPDVKTLARAREQSVLKAWQGLGYYSRARNMLAAARLVAARFGGRFPRDATLLASLPGIGPYTAAAVASIAFGQPAAVVDGNVFRVLSRYFGTAETWTTAAGKKHYQALADGVMDTDNPGRHNQAMMELGALVCTPRQPRCGSCPVRSGCLAYRLGTVHRLPVKATKKALRSRHFHYLVLRWDGNTVMQRRGGADIWRNLFEFPLVEATGPLRPTTALLKRAGIVPDGERVRFESAGTYRHLLSHQRLHVAFFDVRLRRRPLLEKAGLQAIPFSRVARLPVPRLIDKHLRKTARR